MAQLELQIATPYIGFTLVNGTPDIITWTAPNDGQLHRFEIYARLIVSSDMTGGAIYAYTNGSLPHSVNGSGCYLWYSASTIGAGDYPLQKISSGYGSDYKGILGSGEKLTITQETALTMGAGIFYGGNLGIMICPISCKYPYRTDQPL